MIKVENLDVWGFQHAIRGMRNPKNSWERSDSTISEYCGVDKDGKNVIVPVNSLGDNDLSLMRTLYKAGTEHRTYARMIQVSMDITAPLYWWKEMDRYTVGKSQVSCSTMHKIAAKEFTLDDFSHEHLCGASIDHFEMLIDWLNDCRKSYVGQKHKEDWWQIIQLLPSSYNQRRTVCMSYETVFKIIKERTGHKLDEWNDFIVVLKNLPYVKEITDNEESGGF
jgi:hypothetical protein